MNYRPSLAAIGLLHLIEARQGQTTTRADLARVSGRTVVAVDRLMRCLEADGLLTVERVPGSYNRYSVHPVTSS